LKTFQRRSWDKFKLSDCLVVLTGCVTAVVFINIIYCSLQGVTPAVDHTEETSTSIETGSVLSATSPPPSSDGDDSSFQLKNKRLKLACLSKEEKICRVCGDKALGCNFDAISCESCKAFFRRNALKEKVSYSYIFLSL
jgi:hypothetical protein